MNLMFLADKEPFYDSQYNHFDADISFKWTKTLAAVTARLQTQYIFTKNFLEKSALLAIQVSCGLFISACWITRVRGRRRNPSLEAAKSGLHGAFGATRLAGSFFLCLAQVIGARGSHLYVHEAAAAAAWRRFRERRESLICRQPSLASARFAATWAQLSSRCLRFCSTSLGSLEPLETALAILRHC
jgi:hypothetical protein